MNNKTTHRTSDARPVSRALLVIAGIAVLTVLSTPTQAQYHPPMHVGVRCQTDFQYNWNPTLVIPYALCSAFIDTIRATDYNDFYFNLHGAETTFYYGLPSARETCSICGGTDSVDFFFLATHGGIASTDPTVAGFAMWDYKANALTPYMRFGARLKIFATYSCDTLKTSDGRFWSRWGPAYRGGLKISLGAHNLLYDDNPQQGSEFATRMQNGEPVGLVWLEAVWNGDHRNAPSVANTGVNAGDCWNRQGANLAGVTAMPALRDGQIGYVCYSERN